MGHEQAPAINEESGEKDWFDPAPVSPEFTEEMRVRRQQREEESARRIAQWAKDHPSPRSKGPRMTSTTNGYMGGLER